MSIFYLNGSNDLATVPISAIYIRLLVKQLFSFAKIQQFVGYTKKSMFFNDRGRQGLFKSFQKAFNELSISFQKALKEPFNELFNELFNEPFKELSRAFQSMFFFVLPCLIHAKKCINMQKGKGEMNKYPKTRL